MQDTVNPLVPPSPEDELQDTLREYRSATKPVDRFVALKRATDAYELVHPGCAKGKGRPAKGAAPPATRWLAEELGLQARTIRGDIALARRLVDGVLWYLRLPFVVANRNVIRGIVALGTKQAEFMRFAELQKGNANAGRMLALWKKTQVPLTRQALLIKELASLDHFAEPHGENVVVVDGLGRYVEILLEEDELSRRRRANLLAEHSVRWVAWDTTTSDRENVLRCCREIAPMTHVLVPVTLTPVT